ncbi:MAG TPA: tetratricopeptide repeat protein [Nevskiaceae bacterium]|nr:tetratricopeptide repeat protein [Nevskiaceae bacterium]
MKGAFRIIAAACALSLASLPVAAQEAKPQPQISAECKKPRKDPGLISEGLYHQLEGATDLIAKGKNQEAIDKLNKMAEHGGDYEKAIIYYNMGFAYSSMNQLDNALKTFEKSLSFHALPIPQEEQLTFNVGQLYVANGKYDEGIRVLENYINTACTPPPGDAYIFLGNAYAEKKRFADALKYVDLAITKAKEPKESWFQLKLALHYELKQMPQCAQVLLQLIAMAPNKPDYWKQLSGVLFDLKKDQDSLAVLALADRQGFLKNGNEYKNLASIYMLLDIPYKAGTLMQTAIDKGLLPADEKNLDLLSAAWMNARDNDRAEVALKRLAQVSDKGDYWLRLGYVYIGSERWKDAVAMIEKAQAKGVKKPGDAALLLAKAAYEAGDKRKSFNAAQKALTYDETRKQASEWLGYLRQQMGEEAATQAANAATQDASAQKKQADETKKDQGTAAPAAPPAPPTPPPKGAAPAAPAAPAPANAAPPPAPPAKPAAPAKPAPAPPPKKQ